MLTKRYLVSVKNLPAILTQIRKGTAPESFNYEHLVSLGFTSSNDRGIIPLLKDLKFLSENGSPTDTYKRYRNEAESKTVLGEALLEAYGDLFHVNANPTEGDRPAIEGKFKAAHNVTDKVAQLQAATFFALLKNADLAAARKESAMNPPLTPKLPAEATTSRGNSESDAKQLPRTVQIPLSTTSKFTFHRPLILRFTTRYFDPFGKTLVSEPNFREWLFRAIMFEADAEKFRRAGFRIGADQTSAEQSLLERNLAPFPVELRNNAMRMIRLYGLLYCFENSVRQLIRERLAENVGLDWWEKSVSPKIRSFAEGRQEKAMVNTWLEGEKGDLLQYVELGHLSDIIIASCGASIGCPDQSRGG